MFLWFLAETKSWYAGVSTCLSFTLTDFQINRSKLECYRSPSWLAVLSVSISCHLFPFWSSFVIELSCSIMIFTSNYENDLAEIISLLLWLYVWIISPHYEPPLQLIFFFFMQIQFSLQACLSDPFMFLLITISLHAQQHKA